MSRLLESGWPVHHVKEMLGHADLSTTNTYLNVTRLGLRESMERFGTAPRCNPVANTPTIEPRLPRNDDENRAPKSPVHYTMQSQAPVAQVDRASVS